MDLMDQIEGLKRHIALLQQENQDLIDEVAELRRRLGEGGSPHEPGPKLVQAPDSP